MTIDERKQDFQKGFEALAKLHGITIVAVVESEQLNNGVIQARAGLALASIDGWKEPESSDDKPSEPGA